MKASFNSLFEMHQIQQLPNLFNAIILSILYLRCVLRKHGHKMNSPKIELSILYLRCGADQRAGAETGAEPFNSLFEMREVPAAGGRRFGRGVPFNSLFEMPRLPKKLMAGVITVIIFQFSI